VRDYRRPLVIGVILLGSACLRLVDLGSQGLFFDEAWSWSASRLSFAGLYDLALSDPHPPLYYLLLKLLLLVIPDTQFGLRLFGALLSIACLGIVLVFVSSRWNIETTIYVGLLAGLSPFDIYYAQEARMYSLLAFLWVASYLALVKALEGDRRYLFIWPIPAILMAWTHFYGVIVAYMMAGAAVVWGGRGGRSARPEEGGVTPPLHCWAAAACVVIGALPPLALALANANQDAGGAWVPARRDLSALFLLFSAGLAPVRTYFLDSAHLVLPRLAAVPASAWIAAGLAVSGLPAVWGLVTAWRMEKNRRTEALLAILLVLLPAALVFGYGGLTARRVWALKPFLGAAILFYLWAGIGIGAIQPRLLRRCLGAAIVALTLASLWPYYTTWQKSTAGDAFHALPAQAGVIMEPPYLSPLAFYYLGETSPVYGLTAGEADASQPPANRGGEYTLFQIMPPRADEFGLRQRIPCEDLPAAADLWVYGSLDRIRQASQKWPACVTDHQLWVYLDARWQPLK
jgi:mannosyltransferase